MNNNFDKFVEEVKAEQDERWSRVSPERREELRRLYKEALHMMEHDRESLRLSWKRHVESMVDLFGGNIIS